MARDLAGYLSSCFLLVIPILVWNVYLAKYLPAGYAAGGPWDQVPVGLSAVENVLRAVVLLPPLVMQLGASSGQQVVGVGVYAVGVIAYVASWSAQIWAPTSRWSRSVCGFLAPAYTAGIWLTGIGLIGERLLVKLPYHPWWYFTAVGAFLSAHTWHAYLAFEQVRTGAGGRPTRR